MNRQQKCFNQRKCDIGELPDTILIESYMGCNLRCKMCPVPDSQKNMDGRQFSCMSFDTYKNIIDQVSDKRRMIWLNQLGEPLLNPDIVRFVAYATSKGHNVGLTTNGTRLDAHLGEKLIRAGLGEMVFSFDGYTKEVYEKIRVGADYDVVLVNIRQFYRLNKALKGNCSIRVDCIVSDLTFADLEPIKLFWKERDIDINFIPLDDWAGNFQLPAEFGIRRSVADSAACRYPCHLLWVTLVVSAEGNLILCCHDYKKLSNLPSVNEKPLLEIWNTHIRDMRAKHVSGVIADEPCRSCDAWKTMPEFYQAHLAYLDRIKAKIKFIRQKMKFGAL